jgi:Cu-processing system permease protein
MELRIVLEIAREELTINIRNKWTLIYAGVFSLLVVGISYFGMMAEGFAGMQSFTRTSASILNLVLYIVPLVALIMGTLSFTGDKGSTELLFSQPVSRAEVLLGKLLGVFSSMTLSTLVGFVLAGTLILAASGTDGIGRYAALVGLSLLLSLVFLSLSVLAATLSRRKSKAFGLALVLWFFFVLFYDLLAIGGMLLLHEQSANSVLFLSLLGNPVDLVRVASLISLENTSIFGPAGAALVRFFGGSSASIALLLLSLSLWVGVPLVLSYRLMQRQDI